VRGSSSSPLLRSVPGIRSFLASIATFFGGVHNVNDGPQGLFHSASIVLEIPCASLLFLVVPLSADLPPPVLAVGIVTVLPNLVLPDYEYEDRIVDLESHSTNPVRHGHDPEKESQA